MRTWTPINWFSWFDWFSEFYCVGCISIPGILPLVGNFDKQNSVKQSRHNKMVLQMSKLRTACLFLATGGGKFLFHYKLKEFLWYKSNCRTNLHGLLAISPCTIVSRRSPHKRGHSDSGEYYIQYYLLIYVNLLVFVQAGLVFSCVFLGAFITCIVLTIIGGKLNVRKLALSSAISQGLIAICFGRLEFVMELNSFLALSYTLRYLWCMIFEYQECMLFCTGFCKASQWQLDILL